MKRYVSVSLIAIVLFSTLGASNAKEVRFEANIDQTRVAIGEGAQLSLVFHGTQDIPAPDIGSVDGIDARYLGPSTMMTVINGQVSTSITHVYTIIPLRVGKFQLGPFSVMHKGDTYTSNAVALDVVEERGPRQQAPIAEEDDAISGINLDDRLFVNLEAGKVKAYVNELVPVTVKMYVNRMNVSDIQLPTFAQEGFSKVEFKEPRQYREALGGAVYDVLEFKTSIFGTKPGEYKLGPAKIKANIIVKKRTRSRRPTSADDFFDDQFGDSFFDDFFTRIERHPVEIKSQGAPLIIAPMPPQGRPATFTGAIGDYQFLFSASPKKLKSGDPITIKMEVRGSGNFNTVLAPQFENLSGFREYEPQVKTEENGKTFTQVLIPESEKVTEIPRAVFSYYDPASDGYKTIVQGPTPIQVEKAQVEAPAQVINATAPAFTAPAAMGESPPKEDLARDIIFIKDSLGTLYTKGRRLYRNPFFLGLLPIPLLLVIIFFYVYAERYRLNSDIRYAGRVRSQQVLKSGLHALQRELKKGASHDFYEMMFKALQDYLGGRIGIPSAGITYGVVEPVLASKDADLGMITKLKVLFETCDRARFAYAKGGEYTMKDDLKVFEDMLKYLEKVKI